MAVTSSVTAPDNLHAIQILQFALAVRSGRDAFVPRRKYHQFIGVLGSMYEVFIPRSSRQVAALFVGRFMTHLSPEQAMVISLTTSTAVSPTIRVSYRGSWHESTTCISGWVRSQLFATCFVRDLSRHLVSFSRHLVSFSRLLHDSPLKRSSLLCLFPARVHGDLSADVPDPVQDWAEKGLTYQAFQYGRPSWDNGGLSSRTICGKYTG